MEKKGKIRIGTGRVIKGRSIRLSTVSIPSVGPSTEDIPSKTPPNRNQKENVLYQKNGDNEFDEVDSRRGKRGRNRMIAPNGDNVSKKVLPSDGKRSGLALTKQVERDSGGMENIDEFWSSTQIVRERNKQTSKPEQTEENSITKQTLERPLKTADVGTEKTNKLLKVEVKVSPNRSHEHRSAGTSRFQQQDHVPVGYLPKIDFESSLKLAPAEGAKFQVPSSVGMQFDDIQSGSSEEDEAYANPRKLQNSASRSTRPVMEPTDALVDIFSINRSNNKRKAGSKSSSRRSAYKYEFEEPIISPRNNITQPISDNDDLGDVQSSEEYFDSNDVDYAKPAISKSHRRHKYSHGQHRNESMDDERAADNHTLSDDVRVDVNNSEVIKREYSKSTRHVVRHNKEEKAERAFFDKKRSHGNSKMAHDLNSVRRSIIRDTENEDASEVYRSKLKKEERRRKVKEHHRAHYDNSYYVTGSESSENEYPPAIEVNQRDREDDDDGYYSIAGDSVDFENENNDDEFYEKLLHAEQNKQCSDRYNIKPLPVPIPIKGNWSRHSKRKRFPRLDAWKGERIVYERTYNRFGHAVDRAIHAGKPESMKTPPPLKFPNYHKRDGGEISRGERNKQARVNSKRANRRGDSTSSDNESDSRNLPAPEIPASIKFCEPGSPIICKDPEVTANGESVEVTVMRNFDQVSFSKLPKGSNESLSSKKTDENQPAPEAGAAFHAVKFISGYVQLPPLSSKRGENAQNFTQVFTVLKCQEKALAVTIDGKIFSAREKSQFWIPPFSDYSLQNFSERVQVQLQFVLLKP